MAMLAEPRRKQKWCLNPRGNLWSQDETKLGQRLLEKMGWSKGKGLGKKEDGNPDHVKVSYKNDSKGMGFKGHDNAWVAHQDDFNALLTSLHTTVIDSSAGNKSKVELKSLEDKSLKSRKRVHYHKFIRGKDLSKRSAKDLQCIFGKREGSDEATPVEEITTSTIGDENQNTAENVSSSHTIDSGSMKLYFSEKLAKLKERRKLGAVKEDGTADEKCSKQQVAKAQYYYDYTQSVYIEPRNTSCSENDITGGDNVPKMKKRKRDKVQLSTGNSEEIHLQLPLKKKGTFVNVDQHQEHLKRKSKKHKKHKASDMEEICAVDGRSKKNRKKFEGHEEVMGNGSLGVDADVPLLFGKKRKASKCDDLSIKSEQTVPNKKCLKSRHEDSNEGIVNFKQSTSKSDKRTKKSKRHKGDGDSVSQDEVRSMRNAALEIFRDNAQHKADKNNSGEEKHIKDSRGEHPAYEFMNGDGLGGKHFVTDDVHVIDPVCSCKSGFGAYERLPWEISNSLGYYRKMVNPQNKFLVNSMRDRKVFKNSNIFEIKGYEVLPQFECCCNEK